MYMHLHLYTWADYSNILCCETNCIDSLPMFFLMTSQTSPDITL